MTRRIRAGLLWVAVAAILALVAAPEAQAQSTTTTSTSTSSSSTSTSTSTSLPQSSVTIVQTQNWGNWFVKFVEITPIASSAFAIGGNTMGLNTVLWTDCENHALTASTGAPGETKAVNLEIVGRNPVDGAQELTLNSSATLATTDRVRCMVFGY